MNSSSAHGTSAQQEDAPIPRTVGSLWLPSVGGRLWLVAGVFAVLMFLSSLALDWVLLRNHEGTLVTILVSDGLAGLVAGALVLRLLQFGRERRRQIEQRLHTISDMNHHIRNALQVIAFSVHSSKAQELAEINEAVNRIQWALREILPKVEPTFEPFDGSARARLGTPHQGK